MEKLNSKLESLPNLQSDEKVYSEKLENLQQEFHNTQFNIEKSKNLKAEHKSKVKESQGLKTQKSDLTSLVGETNKELSHFLEIYEKYRFKAKLLPVLEQSESLEDCPIM